ncbi:alpha/beta hydrolase [Actinoplanes sp. NPDC049596]|uniref:alpha/beta hydrolase n=1 Tax=unclassified Actinoplanes TaxID=2626549 RepID=UPI00342A0C87
MRILPLALVLSALAVSVPPPAGPSPAARLTGAAPVPASQPPAAGPAPLRWAFAGAYRETAVRMLAAGCPYATWAAQGRHFLSFDPAGDGRAVEVLGDLATASRIAVLVPGVGTTLADFDRGLGGVPRRAPGVQARALFEHLSKRYPHTAVIAWLGYDPPEGLGTAAATYGRARAGAAALVAFVRDLLRQRPGLAGPAGHQAGGAGAVTLIGHSYGALVAGLAAPDLPAVRDVITLGAPGIGAGHAADLGGARVWSALAPTDWIRRIPEVRFLGVGLGRRPSNPGFGAFPLPTDGVAGHDYYLTPGSATLRAVGDVILSGVARHDATGDVS